MNIKKRLIVCLIVCTVSLFIFAITASAEDIYYYHDFDAQVETVAGMPELPADGVLQSPGRVVLKDSEEAYHTYPAYYIVKNQATFATDYTALNAATGESYTDASVYMIDIPYGITTINNGIFGHDKNTPSMTSVQKVIMPDSVTVLQCLSDGGSDCFRNNPSILYIEVSSGVTELGNYTFAQMPNVKEIRFRSGSQLQKIGENVFANLPSLREIYIDMSGVTSVGKSAFVFGSKNDGGCDFVQWYDTDGIKVVDLRNITSFSENVFASSNLGSADKILWPTVLNSIGSQAFRKANIRGIMYIGGGNTDISINDVWTFRGNNIDTIIFGANVNKIAVQLLFESLPYLENIVFLADSVDIGTDSNAFKNNANTDLHRNVYYKSFSKKPTSYWGSPVFYTWTSFDLQNYVDQCKLQVVLTTADGNVTVGGDTHLSDEGTDVPATCLTAEGIKYTCLCCGKQIGEIEAKEGGDPALGHTAGDTVLGLVYNNGFDKIGEKTCKCVRCNASVLVNADAIFVSQGFSILPSGEVYISFSLSKTALNEFNTVNDCAVRYGVFVSNGAVTFDSNGAITNDKAIWAEINTDSQFSRFGITISGLESYADQALAYGAYTIDSSDNVKIIQKDSVAYDGASVTASGSGITEPITVYTRTYNGIKGVQNQSLALYDKKYFYAYAA